MNIKLLDWFFRWYEKNYTLNVGIASFLFILQLFHLYWLTTHVLIFKLFGLDLFPTSQFASFLIAIVDYTEIPALITSSFVYINELKKGFELKSLGFLLLINSQWLHLFWITDEFVVTQFTSKIIAFPFFLAILAILIDYLELPVIFDVTKKFMRRLKKNKGRG